MKVFEGIGILFTVITVIVVFLVLWIKFCDFIDKVKNCRSAKIFEEEAERQRRYSADLVNEVKALKTEIALLKVQGAYR